MALEGGGAIIIWNDIAPDGRDEFYDWHINEHIPERLAIPGFRRGSRYRAMSSVTSPEFLTLYEISGASVATSAAYLARLNAPTDWTKRATSYFRNTSRALTQIVLSLGPGQGGVMGTVRFDSSPEGRTRVQNLASARMLLEKIAAMPRVTGVHLCTTDSDASAAKTTESRERRDILVAPAGALLIEGCDVAAVSLGIADVMTSVDLDRAVTTTGLYLLEHMQTASHAWQSGEDD